MMHCFNATIVLTCRYVSIVFSHGLVAKGWPPQIAVAFLNECPYPLNWRRISVKWNNRVKKRIFKRLDILKNIWQTSDRAIKGSITRVVVFNLSMTLD